MKRVDVQEELWKGGNCWEQQRGRREQLYGTARASCRMERMGHGRSTGKPSCQAMLSFGLTDAQATALTLHGLAPPAYLIASASPRLPASGPLLCLSALLTIAAFEKLPRARASLFFLFSTSSSQLLACCTFPIALNMASDSESAEPAPLQWSAQFDVAASSKTRQLPGDKLLLPPSALEQLLAAAPVVSTQSASNQPHTSAFDPFNPHTFAAERNARELQYQDRVQQLPHPLTFRLVNPDNGKAVYAGIREFSADDGEVVLSKFLRESLGLESQEVDDSNPSSGHTSDEDATIANGVEDVATNGKAKPRITIHAKQLPKGTFVKLRPLEAGYDPEDWKSLLEQHMRSNFTTLTDGEILVIPGGRGAGGKKQEFRFLIDGFKPEGDGICVVDTDLEVDIEALNEEQARETLKRIAAKMQKAPGTTGGSSAGGKLDLLKAEHGQVLDGEYVDYEIPSWIRAQGIEIELSGVNDEEEVDLYVNPFGPRQRTKPRADEHVFADVSSKYPKRVRLRPTNVELEDAESLRVSVHAYATDDSSAEKSPKTYQIRAAPFDPNDDNESHKTSETSLDTKPPNPDNVQCKNCHQWVPKGSLFLHENFCLRNNIVCPKGCNQVFQKRSEAFSNHWHCPHDTFYGNTALSHAKHHAMFHTSHTCDHCNRTFTSLSQLAHHKTTVCPGKHILCQFCHLEVPQEGDPDEPNHEALLSGLTPHELADGGRTTECHLCNKIIRLRDMSTHLKHHEFEKLSRPAPRLCRNSNCGRTLDGASKTGDTRVGTRKGQAPGNDIGLCSVCFGPLYVSMYDPEGKALRRRVERRYLTQLLTGCGKDWCRNEMCKTGRQNQKIEPPGFSSKEALPVIKPLLDKLPVKEGETPETPMHFCTDESSQKKRNLAEMLAAEGNGSGKDGYGLEWCVAAMEAEGGDLQKAREWLKGWAPQREEAN